MKENENLYDKIEEMFGKNPGNLNILEQKIDVDVQMEYFEFSKKMTSEFDEYWAIDQSDCLLDEDYPIPLKKKLLARLASVNKVECYRTIESYMNNPDEELKDWACLSLYESRMHLEGDLLGENQIFISTGLGGKAEKLRYFTVFIARNRVHLDATQKRIMKNEFEYILKKYDAEIEDVQFSEYMATILLVMPIQYSIKQIFQDIIDECNQYGDFLRDKFIVTNVKVLSFNDIKDFIEKKNLK